MSAYDWKDGEIAYCERLVQTRGNPDVPRAAVASYLRTQIASADMDRTLDSKRALLVLFALLNDWNATGGY